jgi:hypothetical protein
MKLHKPKSVEGLKRYMQTFIYESRTAPPTSKNIQDKERITQPYTKQQQHIEKRNKKSGHTKTTGRRER